MLSQALSFILQVKTEKGSGSNSSDPYVAFRKRTEKMQTRKNRKNDESSYEKMLKLRRDLSRAVTLLEMVKRREKAKREYLNLNIEVFERRLVVVYRFSILWSRPFKPFYMTMLYILSVRVV